MGRGRGGAEVVVKAAAAVCEVVRLYMVAMLRFINQPSLPIRFLVCLFVFLFCSCVFFRLYGPFNCISFHNFSQLLSVF